jgi:hypothetical protein
MHLKDKNKKTYQVPSLERDAGVHVHVLQRAGKIVLGDLLKCMLGLVI